MKHTLGERWQSKTRSSHIVLMEVSKIRRKRTITHTNEVHVEKNCTNITGHCILMHGTPQIKPYHKHRNVIM